MNCHRHEFKASIESERRGTRFTCAECRVFLEVEESFKCSSCGITHCSVCVLMYAMATDDLDRYLREPTVRERLEDAFTLDEEYEIETPDEDSFEIVEQDSVVEDLESVADWREVEGFQLVRTQLIVSEHLGDIDKLFDDIQKELDDLNKEGSVPLVQPRSELKEGRGEDLAPPRRKGLTRLWDELKSWMDD